MKCYRSIFVAMHFAKFATHARVAMRLDTVIARRAANSRSFMKVLFEFEKDSFIY